MHFAYVHRVRHGPRTTRALGQLLPASHTQVNQVCLCVAGR